MPMYNLIEYNENYSDTSGSLWQFKRDGIEGDVDLTVDANHIPNNSSSFKNKSSFITKKNGVIIVVTLKCLGNFWRSLEMPSINCKVELSLKWYEHCILSSEGTATAFATTDTKLYVPVVILKNWRQYKIIRIIKQGI